MKVWAPEDVTEVLRQQIVGGEYAEGDALPVLSELNERFFGVDAGPRPGRSAYAPLIAAGMVEARQGRGGGHFVVSTRPAAMSTAFTGLGERVSEAAAMVAELRDTEFWVVEFESLRGDGCFGESLHPSRLAAEKFAVDILVRLGEEEERARTAASAAGWTCADTRPAGYGVRIYGYTIGGERPHPKGRPHHLSER